MITDHKIPGTVTKLYEHNEQVHNFSAAQEVVPFIVQLFRPVSVLDVGCGIGTWLKVFDENGVHDYLGIDGNYVDRTMLKIPAARFYPSDLRNQLNLKRKFDLVISLEVAEHLEEPFADNLISTLIAHGDVIIFSAAIPGQGGQNHHHERWLSFWAGKFARHNYMPFDVLRSIFWDNRKVDLWYRQNMMVFCKKGHPMEAGLAQRSSGYVDIVHPELYTAHLNQINRIDLYEQGKLGLRIAWKALLNALKNSFR